MQLPFCVSVFFELQWNLGLEGVQINISDRGRSKGGGGGAKSLTPQALQ
jgi:hypothetical protein